LDFFDYAWASSFQITKKKHEDVKILVRDDVTFPVLGKDDKGYVICLPEPKTKGRTVVQFQGLRLNLGNELHKRILWQLFRASVFHLSAHVATDGFESYVDWAKDKNQNLAMYAASLVEDAIIAAYAKKAWSPFIPDIALANAISYLRLKPSQVLFEDPLRIMAAIISYFIVGKGNGRIPKEMLEDVNDCVLYLRQIEELASKQLTEKEDAQNALQRNNRLDKKKLELADEVYWRLYEYGRPSETLTLPYTDSYGRNSVYHSNITATAEEFNEALKLAFAKLDSEVFTDESLERETTQAFSVWEATKAREQKIIETYKEFSAGSRFSAIEFPKEDYTEFLRSKQLLSSPIRRVLEKLRLLKNILGEDFKHESGLVDLQEAIQVIASQSQRTDIFVREELQTREEAWAIIIDASHSLNFFTGEVRGIALCLAETAKNLILNRAAWGMFAFNDKFYIVKDFEENYTTRVRARIGGLIHGGLTYMPDGINIVTNKMRQHIESSKIIVLVSDFFPSGYPEAENELLQTIRQKERAGFGIIGVGVKSRAAKNYLRNYCTVETPYDLMKKFTKAFLEYSTTV
jgi:hypothetical protein